ncbi:MAG: response regulator [Candidatus Eisenbacteria bacterium]|uniref:Response regulator n=1 Tax=Eiseniibacteriota bacterium TaxID=2212470 RepID=A0A933WAC1_UNCEI|nr:response regulator [Candidatus Eisenbacteria bacterium]
MKALVVDPDRSARAVVKRLLSHVNVDVIEADNGLIALNALEQADPDFVVVEIDMPILTGPDCLAAIRQSPVRPDIPVIVISASGTRENVHRMVALGVADFLLKPINPVEVLPRIKNLLIRVAQWRQRQSSRSINSLLIVDNDPNFMAFAKPLLDSTFEILEAGSSTGAAITYRDASPKPTVVCLAEGLPLMNEDLLVDVIRKMAIESGSNPPQFFLLSKTAEVPPDKAARYAGFVRKSFIPQTFVDEFRRIVLREQSPYERLRHIVREGLRSELVTATQQTIGVMIGSEIEELGEGEGADGPTGVLAELSQLDTASGVSLRTIIMSGRSEVERMASQIVRRPITFEEGANEVVGELANTIAGRMRACLMSRGFDLKMGLPEIRTQAEGEPVETGFDLTAGFRCSSGELFQVALHVKQVSPGLGMLGGATETRVDADVPVDSAPAAPAAPAAPTAAPVAGPAEAQAQQSVDDVLF